MDDIFYLSIYAGLDAAYVDNLSVFEREFYIHRVIKKLKTEKEMAEGNNG